MGSTLLAGTPLAASYVGMPLLLAGEVHGMIELVDMRRENSFTEANVRLLQTIASSVGIALDNARLFDETQRLLKETRAARRGAGDHQ